jgi:hypothetical protein
MNAAEWTLVLSRGHYVISLDAAKRVLEALRDGNTRVVVIELAGVATWLSPSHVVTLQPIKARPEPAKAPVIVTRSSERRLPCDVTPLL